MESGVQQNHRGFQTAAGDNANVSSPLRQHWAKENNLGWSEASSASANVAIREKLN